MSGSSKQSSLSSFRIHPADGDALASHRGGEQAESASAQSSHSAPPPPGGPDGPQPPDEQRASRRRPWMLFLGSGVLLLAIAVSTAVHFGFFAYLHFGVMPPLRYEGELMLNPRLVTVFNPAEEEPEEVLAQVEEEVPEPEELAPPEPKAPPEPEPEPDNTRIDEPVAEAPPDLAPMEEAGGGGMDLVGMGGSGGSGVALPTGSGTGRGQGSGSGSGSGERVAVAPAAEQPRSRRERPSAIQLEDTSVAPKAISQVPALGYPREFREAGLEGRVVVQCIITERGAVRACRHRSGPKELADYAMSIIREWKFEPGKDHAGKNVPVAYTFRFPFRLR